MRVRVTVPARDDLDEIWDDMPPTIRWLPPRWCTASVIGSRCSVANPGSVKFAKICSRASATFPFGPTSSTTAFWTMSSALFVSCTAHAMSNSSSEALSSLAGWHHEHQDGAGLQSQ